MNTMQRKVIAYLNDYISEINLKAYEFECMGLKARSDRQKLKAESVRNTVAKFRMGCADTVYTEAIPSNLAHFASSNFCFLAEPNFTSTHLNTPSQFKH